MKDDFAFFHPNLNRFKAANAKIYCFDYMANLNS